METESKYELQHLERIIVNDIAGFIHNGYAVPDELVADFRNAIKKETERVKNNIALAVLHFNGRRGMKFYILRHQLNLIQLSGKLLDYLSPRQIVESTSPDHSVFLNCLYDALEELMLFVEKQFPGYYDRNAWIPVAYRRIAVYDLDRNIETIRDKLVKAGVLPELVTLGIQPLQEFTRNSFSPGNKVTYGKLKYLKRLKDEFQKIKFTGNNDPSVTFQFRLLKLNLNSSGYYSYCINQIEEYKDAAGSLAEKLERLAFVQKLVHQAPVKKHWAYNPDAPSLKEQLSNWLNQEIAFLKLTEQLHTEPPDFQGKKEKISRIKTILSVPQLALVLRAGFETNAIQTRSANHLIKMASQFLSTKETDTPSYGSLHNKYYDTEDGARQAVINLLQQLIDYIKRSR